VVQSCIKGAGAIVALALIFNPLPGFAQQAPNGEWFVPGQARPAAAPQQSRPGPRAAAAPSNVNSGLNPLPGGDGVGDQAGATPPQFKLPPAPDIPPVPKGQATPAAIVGILSVPDVLRVSTAYQAAYKELNTRGQKLNEDAQKEKEIQDRATEAQRRFGERNRIIQEAGQYVMLQINRTMEQVAQQVALSRGINLVLNRAQILGTTADFDLTPAVADVLNKALPSVVVPPDGVSALAMAPGSPPKAESTAAAAPPAAKPPQKH
jgi:hypothetical protein